MVDCKVRGASWLTIPAGKHNARLKFETTCAYECTVDYRDIIPHEPEGDWADIAPMRILSYDIECAGRKGIFPEPEHDPVIQIATMVQCQGKSLDISILQKFHTNSKERQMGQRVCKMEINCN